jgi:hypothetical protein
MHNSEVAWQLVDAHRHLLTAVEQTAIFVNLGSGEHLLVIRDILRAVAAKGSRLVPPFEARMQDWIDSRDLHAEFDTLFAAATGGCGSRAESRPPARH